MRKRNFGILVSIGLVFTGVTTYAQMYYTSNGAEVIERNGKDWIEKQLPPSIIIFSDRSGQAELKEDLSSLIETTPASLRRLQQGVNYFADFKMKLNKQQVVSQLYTGKMFNSTGVLQINNIVRYVPIQYLLDPSGDIENGFTISMIFRFVPKDFDINVSGDNDNAPIILKINAGVVDEI
ncbi:MAG: hypothetical protein JSS70_11965 [Bacteroidetes bacterium]|nr:hypothetical protein [Bacteroidota bacterium]